MPSTNRAKNTKDGHIIYATAILDNEFAVTMYVCTSACIDNYLLLRFLAIFNQHLFSFS